MDSVCVIGLGVTGGSVARRLLDRGFGVGVYDSDPRKAATLAAVGARLARIPADAAEPADVVFVDVPDEAAVEEVLFDCGGVGETLRDGGVVVIACPVGSAFLRSAAGRLEDLGLHAMEAWFTGSQQSDEHGGPPAAALVGCPLAVLGMVTSALEGVGGEVVRTGPVGSVAALRGLGAALRAVPPSVLPEGRTVAERPVLDPRQVLQVLANAAPTDATEESPTGRWDGSGTASLAEAVADVWWAVRDALHNGVALTSVELTAAALLGGPGDGEIGRSERARLEARDPLPGVRPHPPGAAPLPHPRSGEAVPARRRPSEPSRTTGGVFSLQELDAAIDAATRTDRPPGDGPSAGWQGPAGSANCLGLEPEVFAGVIAEVERRCRIPVLRQAYGCSTPTEFVALINTQLMSGV